MSGLSGVKVHLVDSVDDAMKFLSWLGEARPILAVDTETEGFDWWQHRVRLIQFGDGMNGWAIPWDLWGGVARDALRRYEGEIVMHNSKFDVHMIEHWSADAGWPFAFDRSKVHDTRIMAHILDPVRSTALKRLTSMLIDPKAASAQRVLDEAMAKNGWGWDTVPIMFEPYWAYGALDTVLTARLDELLRPRVMSEAPRAYDIEMGAQWVIANMETRGTMIDRQYTAQSYEAFLRRVEQVDQWVKTNYGVNPGTNADVIARLQADTGYVFTDRTEGGQLKLDKDVLNGVIGSTGHPLALAVLDRRRAQKMASTYLKNFLRLATSEDLMHPVFNVLGARTSRVSMQNPNLHNLPRKSDTNVYANTVRNCIRARAGNELVLCDFDQIEMRMIAHLADDPGLRAAFGEGDFFLNVCRELWGDPTIQKADDKRQHTKNGMYALGYGAGPAKIAQTTGQTLDAVQLFLNLLNDRFPGIKRLQQQVANTAFSRQASEGIAYVKSPLTGRRHVADKGKEYALVNYLVQGTAAEVLKLKLLELDAVGLGPYMILNVHDEVILDVPVEDAPQAAELTERTMTDHTLFSVPLTAGIDRAQRWGMKGG